MRCTKNKNNLETTNLQSIIYKLLIFGGKVLSKTDKVGILVVLGIIALAVVTFIVHDMYIDLNPQRKFNHVMANKYLHVVYRDSHNHKLGTQEYIYFSDNGNYYETGYESHLEEIVASNHATKYDPHGKWSYNATKRTIKLEPKMSEEFEDETYTDVKVSGDKVTAKLTGESRTEYVTFQ